MTVPTRRRTPLPLLAPAAVGALFLVAPLLVLMARAPWRQLPTLLTHHGALTALRLSLLCATAATVGCVVLGVPLAYVLARSSHRATAVLRSLVMLPLVLPPVVAGVALLLTFGRTGALGRPLRAATGWTLPFSTAGVVMAETFVALPFLVITVEGALRASSPLLEEAAATLGAGPLTVFRRITVPLVWPSLVAGSMLSWARALGEFGATITFAGNLPGRTQTMPLAVYVALETDPQAAYALSLVLIVVCVAVLVLLRGRWLRMPGSP